MLKSLYTLSKQYKSKKIVIYGVNRNAVIIFAKLALNHQVDVNSFWDVDGQFVGEYFVNRKIISTGQLTQMNNAIVILPEVVEKQEILHRTGRSINLYYINEILDLNEDLNDKKIYIYGIGNRGELVYDALLSKEISIAGVCVTRLDGIMNWHGKDVFTIEQFGQYDDCVFIVATDKECFQKEMLKQLEKKVVEKYLCFFMSEHAIFEGNFFQVINISLLRHQDIWIYSTDDENAIYLSEIFDRYQIKLDKRIGEESIFDLAYEDIEGISVIVAENDEYKMEWVCESLDKIGFGLDKWNYTATGLYTHKVALQAGVKKDALIGFSTFESDRYPGYFVYGNEETAQIRIMVLGGSTSTENIYRTVSWVRYLYEKMLKENYAPIIFNGAVCGHGITDEFLHMVRDIKPLKPDIVISFSGVNNTFCRKTKNQFNIRFADSLIAQGSEYITGIESEETLYDFWYRISKLIKLVAEQYGAKTYTFLQPMSTVKENLDLMETGMFDYIEHTNNIREFKSRVMVERDMFYVNLISMFEKNMPYIDYTHYSSEGNKLIAEYVFDVIKSNLQKN